MKARRGLPIGLALFLASSAAWADKVAVLPFTAAEPATKEDAESARAATRAAVTARGHTLPTDAEMLTAEMAVADGAPDTSDEFAAAARASSSEWTLAARVEASAGEAPGDRPGPYRIELFAYQVSSGRVESLARTVDPARADAQIGEMLALLLRPEGVGDAEIRWNPTPAPEPPPAPPVPAAPPPEPPPPARRYAYAEGHPLSVGAGVALRSAIARPSNAQGNATSLMIEGAVGYAFDGAPGLEVRADVGGAVAGPRALYVEGGARYAFMLAPTIRLYAGPEAGLGAFFTLGGDKRARFSARGSAFVGIGLSDRFQLEIFGDVAGIPGGAGGLVLGGGGVRGAVRF